MAKGFDLAASPGHLLRRCQQFAFDVYAEEVGGDGLTPRQFSVLATVDQNEGASQTDLVRLTGIDRSTLADMIGRLLKKGFLERERTETDQRANAVRLTPPGRKAMKAQAEAVGRAEKRLLEPLPSRLRGDFVKALGLIAEAASAHEIESANGAAKRPARKPARKKRR